MLIRNFHIYKIIALVIICQSTYAEETLSSETSKEYEILLLEVTHLYERTRLNEYAWRDTEKMITEAKKLAHHGNFMQANKYLHKAKEECVLAKQQAETQTKLSELLPYYLK